MCSIYQQSSISSTWSTASHTSTLASTPASHRLTGDRFISARCGQEAGSNFDTKAMIFQEGPGKAPCYFYEEERNQENNQGSANGVP